MPRCRLLSCLLPLWATAAMADPLFPNSVASNDLDFITDDDPGAAFCLRFDGLTSAEMPDKRNDILFADNVRTFTATYSDDTTVGLWVHPDIVSEEEATELATAVADAIAKLPNDMRSLLNHVVIHAATRPHSPKTSVASSSSIPTTSGRASRPMTCRKRSSTNPSTPHSTSPMPTARNGWPPNPPTAPSSPPTPPRIPRARTWPNPPSLPGPW